MGEVPGCRRPPSRDPEGERGAPGERLLHQGQGRDQDPAAATRRAGHGLRLRGRLQGAVPPLLGPLLIPGGWPTLPQRPLVVLLVEGLAARRPPPIQSASPLPALPRRPALGSLLPPQRPLVVVLLVEGLAAPASEESVVRRFIFW